MFLEIDVSGIESKIEKCESTEDFKKEIIPLIKTEKEEWIEKITAIIKASGLSKTKFADICGVSRGSVNKWCKGSVPKKKETFLKIAGVAHYNADETKELLQRYGKCSRLDVENEKEDYNIFYASIITLIEVNYEKEKITVSKLADSQGWSSSLRQTISAIRQKKWCPTRNKIISLGLHFNMNKEQINELLGLAYMKPLSATNLYEATVLYILESVQVNFTGVDKGYQDSCFMLEYTADVIKKIDIPEVMRCLSEFENNDED